MRIVTEIHDLTVAELAAAIRRRELSPVQITAHYLDRMDRLNATVGAFFTITAELATEQAAEAEKAVARADDPAALPPLTGVPIPIKDLNMVAGVRQTLGSAVFADNVPDDGRLRLCGAPGGRRRCSPARRPPRSSACPATPRPRSGRPPGPRGT